MTNTQEAAIGAIFGTKVVSQYLDIDYSNLFKIQIKIGTFGRINSGNLIIKLFIENNYKQPIRSSSFPCHSLRDNSFLDFIFDPIMDSRGKRYLLFIESQGCTSSNAVTIYYRAIPNSELSINNIKFKGNLVLHCFTDANAKGPLPSKEIKALFVHSDHNCSCTLKSTIELSRAVSQHCQADVLFYSDLKEEHFIKYNIIFLQRLGGNGARIQDSYIDNLRNLSKKYYDKTRIIYTIDDLITNDVVEKMVSLAQLIVVPNKSYDKYFAKLNGNIKYIRTFIDSETFQKVKKIRNDKKFNIIWASTAALGLSFMERLVPKLVSQIPNIELTTLGRQSRIFASLKEVRQLPIQSYENMLSYFKGSDLCLNPITTDGTNEDFVNCKSEIKYLHAGLAQIPIISSRSFPYEYAIKNKVNGILLDNDVDLWIEAVKEVINGSPDIKNMVAAAYLDVTSNYLLRNAGSDVFNIFINELNRNPGIRCKSY